MKLYATTWTLWTIYYWLYNGESVYADQQTISASIVDASGNEFDSMQSFCAFHCRVTHVNHLYGRRHLSECQESNCGTFLVDQQDNPRYIPVDSAAATTTPPTTRRKRKLKKNSGDATTITASNHSEPSPSHQQELLFPEDDKRVVHNVNFASCRQVGSTPQQTIEFAFNGPDKSIFDGFFDSFFQAYDAMVSSQQSSLQACQLEFLQEKLFNVSSSLANSTQQRQQLDQIGNLELPTAPTLVKFNATFDAGQCKQKVRTIWTKDDELTTPFVSLGDANQTRASIMLMHLNGKVSKRILALDCVQNVIKLPAILKLTPFARSSLSLRASQTKSGQNTVNSGPSLSIYVVKSLVDGDSKNHDSVNSLFKRLSSRIRQVTGLKNVLTWNVSVAPRVFVSRALDEYETWVQLLSIVLQEDGVEWVDYYTKIVTGALTSSVSIAEQTIEQRMLQVAATSKASPLHKDEIISHPQTRRLDQYIHDLVGIRQVREAGILGQDIIVGVTDTGLYMDHNQLDQSNHSNVYDTLDLDARKVVRYHPWADRYDQSEKVTCGHGTHVAGILAGSSFDSSNGEGDLGIATKSRIAFMDIGKQSSKCQGEQGCTVDLETPGDAGALLASQIKAGAKIFSFSWGTPGGDYSVQARDLDDYIYHNPDTLVVVAAGNSGEKGSSTISSPSGAKNVISVGASLNRAESFSDSSCSSVFNEQSVASFSSSGPTSDGRLKPDLVAPGMSVVSACSQPPGSTDKTSQTCSLQGTSQATPIVAGMAVLLYEWLRDGWWYNGLMNKEYGMDKIPAALMKALLIHSGEPLTRRLQVVKTGSVTCETVKSNAQPLSYPDQYQGYGKPNFKNLASFSQQAQDQQLFFMPNTNNSALTPSVAQDKSVSMTFLVKHGVDLRVTLVWTDPAGSLGGKSLLQHDLDLTVRIQNTSIVFYPLTGKGQPDRVNNVEMVQVSYNEMFNMAQQSGVPLGEDGAITVEATVYGTRVLTASQDFALVASSTLAITTTTNSHQDATDPSFWKPWMSLAAVAVAALAVLVMASAMIFSRYRRRRALQRLKDDEEVAKVNNPTNVSMEAVCGDDSVYQRSKQ